MLPTRVRGIITNTIVITTTAQSRTYTLRGLKCCYSIAATWFHRTYTGACGLKIRTRFQEPWMTCQSAPYGCVVNIWVFPPRSVTNVAPTRVRGLKMD